MLAAFLAVALAATPAPTPAMSPPPDVVRIEAPTAAPLDVAPSPWVTTLRSWLYRPPFAVNSTATRPALGLALLLGARLFVRHGDP